MRNRGYRASLVLAASAIACASTAEASETITYSYDTLGRLVRVEHKGAVNHGVNARYGYDPADNRTNVTVSGLPSVAGGGFEAPDAGVAHFYRPAGGPASFAGNSGVAGNGSTWGFAAAPEGDQVAFLQGGNGPAAISLQVTGLTPGAAYKVDYWISARPGYWRLPLSLSFDGVPIGTIDPPTSGFTAAASAAFTAAAGTGTLTFTGSASSVDYSSGLDRVTIAAAGSN